MKEIKRRSFLSGMAGVGAGMVTGCANLPFVGQSTKEIPKRTLGRTKVEVPILGLGTACIGNARIGKEKAVPLIHEAIDLGVTYLDTARVYNDAEMYLGEVLPTRRDEVFLVEKVMTDNYKEAEKSFEDSLRTLKVDHVDLLHMHNVGGFETDKVMGPGGTMEFVLKMKEQGKARFVGVTGHTRADRFLPVIETDQFDALMVTLNFVDKHTYNFEDRILPLARKHNMGIVAMKVFGGREQENFKGFSKYKTPGPSNLPSDALEDAFRYSLSLEGVSCSVIGLYNQKELRQNVALAKTFQPLSEEEKKRMDTLGQDQAAVWREHYGAV